ncbi:MAG TPA: hypothetical protein VFS07_07985 [Gemmatimonadales bacterium]|jgi:hypothetical protein|nr:hypothetical protein [Gemmatimonadales bacterium]
MKKALALAALLGLAACAPKENPAPAADSTMAPAAAPAAMDSTMQDSTMKDSTMAAPAAAPAGETH